MKYKIIMTRDEYLELQRRKADAAKTNKWKHAFITYRWLQDLVTPKKILA